MSTDVKAASRAAAAPDRGVRVWDPLVRVLHWALVLVIAAAWVSEDAGPLHERIGYAALCLVAVRLAWGLAGSRYARLAQFVRSPRVTLAYAQQMVVRQAPRYLGHNPLGGWMILALLLAVGLTGLTGWLMITDRFWGVEWMEELHEGLASGLLLLAAFHVGGVLWSSLAHRENLVAAMFSGRKRAPGPDDVA